MDELHAPGGDLQIQTLEVIGLYSKQKEVWGAPTMERAIREVCLSVQLISC